MTIYALTLGFVLGAILGELALGIFIGQRIRRGR